MKVIKNYLYNASYQLLIMLAPLITTPYVARVLGAHESGIYTYTNGWVTIFYLIGQLGITVYGNREIAYHRDDIRERSKIFWSIELLQLITIFVALISYLAVVFMFSSTFKVYYLIQTLWILATAIDVSWFFMGMEDFKKTVVRNTLVKITTIILIFLLIKDQADLWKYVALLSGAQFLGNLTLWPYLRGLVQRVSIQELNIFKHLYPSMILFIPTITVQIYLVVNKIMLGKLGTPDALGQFDYSDRIIKVILSLVTATGTVMLPNMANKFAKGDVNGIRESLYKSFDFVTSLAVPLMFGIMAISHQFAPWFLGQDYVHAGEIMFWEAPVIILIAWSNVLGMQYLMPVNRVKEFTTTVTVGAIVNVCVNIFMIPIWSAKGAAVGSVAAELAVTVAQLYVVRSTIARRGLFKGSWKYFLAGGLMFVIINYVVDNLPLNIITLALDVLVGVLSYAIGIFVLKAPIIKQMRATGIIKRR